MYLDLTSVVQALDFSQMPGGSLMPRVPAISPHVNGLIEYMVETAGSKKVVFGSDLPWYSQHYHAGAVLFCPHLRRGTARHPASQRRATVGKAPDRGRRAGIGFVGPAVNRTSADGVFVNLRNCFVKHPPAYAGGSPPNAICAFS